MHGTRAARYFPLLLVALLGAGGQARAHDFERTRVSMTFARDGAFVLDIVNDPNWLLLRLEPFAADAATKVAAYDGPREVAPYKIAHRALTSEERDLRLAQLAPVFIDRVVLFVDGHEIRATSARYHPPAATTDATALATYRLRGRMPVDARSLRWFYGLVIDPYPLTVRHADGADRMSWIHSGAWSETIDLAGRFQAPTRVEVARQYLHLGYTHILPKGADHILFVIGLLLLNIRLRPILMQVTAFTIAHSITLALAMYGIVALPARIVEPLIALSIAYVAAENLLTRELQPWRLALVFAFGLLHGMGFAGVLRELELPRSQFLTALLSFNLGVEGGQLTVVAFAGLSVAWYRHRQWYRYRVVMPASTLIAGVGLYWTVARLV